MIDHDRGVFIDPEPSLGPGAFGSMCRVGGVTHKALLKPAFRSKLEDANNAGPIEHGPLEVHGM